MTARRSWHKLDRYDKTIPPQVLSVLQASARDREHELMSACINAFAYERDKWNITNFSRGPQSGVFTALRGGHDGGAGRQALAQSLPQINMLKGKIDVLTDKILQNQPTLKIRTSNASYEQLRQHDIRARALHGALSDPRSMEAQYLWTRDGLIKRIGYAQVVFRHGRLQVQRLQPWEVYYDMRDSSRRDLTQIHTVQLVDRDEFLAWYKQLNLKIPERAAIVRQLESLPASHHILPGTNLVWQGAFRWLLDESLTSEVADNIRVAWSYKRAWRHGGEGGRVVCTVISDGGDDSVVALDEPFIRDTLPVVWWSPWIADQGITGVSLAEQLVPTQLAIDRTLFKMQRLQDKYGHYKWLVPRGTLTDDQTRSLLTAGVTVVEFEGGAAPEMVRPLVMSAEDVTWLNFLLDRPASEQGITPVLSQGQSALGANASGVARVEEVFVSLDRQAGVRAAHGRGRQNLGTQIMNAVDDALTVDKTFIAQWQDDAGRLISQPWSELTLPAGKYSVGLEDVGVLGSTRAGRIQKGTELADRGLMTKESLKNLLYGSPDLAAVSRRERAPRMAIEAQLEILLKSDASDEELARAQPTTDMDLADLVLVATAEINSAMADNASAETIARLRAWRLAATRVSGPPPPQAEAISAG